MLRRQIISAKGQESIVMAKLWRQPRHTNTTMFLEEADPSCPHSVPGCLSCICVQRTNRCELTLQLLVAAVTFILASLRWTVTVVTRYPENSINSLNINFTVSDLCLSTRHEWLQHVGKPKLELWKSLISEPTLLADHALQSRALQFYLKKSNTEIAHIPHWCQCLECSFYFHQSTFQHSGRIACASSNGKWFPRI